MDAYSPFPVEGLAEALGHESSPVPLFTLAGGMVGGLGGVFHAVVLDGAAVSIKRGRAAYE